MKHSILNYKGHFQNIIFLMNKMHNSLYFWHLKHNKALQTMPFREQRIGQSQLWESKQLIVIGGQMIQSKNQELINFFDLMDFPMFFIYSHSCSLPMGHLVSQIFNVDKESFLVHTVGNFGEHIWKYTYEDGLTQLFNRDFLQIVVLSDFVFTHTKEVISVFRSNPWCMTHSVRNPFTSKVYPYDLLMFHPTSEEVWIQRDSDRVITLQINNHVIIQKKKQSKK